MARTKHQAALDARPDLKASMSEALAGEGLEEVERSTKAMTLRLDTEQAEALEMVANIDGASVSETIRVAIARHVADRAADVDFRAHLDESMERYKGILDRLAAT